MNKFFVILVLLCWSISAQAVVPISPSTPVYSAGVNMLIQRGTNPNGQEVVFLYWETYGFLSVVKHCSITTVEEFLTNIDTKKSVVEAVYSITPNGVLWEWTSVVPGNLNEWCPP